MHGKGIVNESYKIFALCLGRCDSSCETMDKLNSAKITAKGRLTVPSRIRHRFGIKPGTRVSFVEEGDRIIFQPVTREYISSFCGVFKQKPGKKSVVQELLEERRTEREKENK